MKKLFLVLGTALAVFAMTCLVSCSGSSDGPDTPEQEKEKEEEQVKLDFSALNELIAQIDAYLALEGKEDSGYPEAAFAMLKSAKAAAQKALTESKTQNDVGSAESAARYALQTFEGMYQAPKPKAGLPCELYLPGATATDTRILLGNAGDFDGLTTLCIDFWFKGDRNMNYQQQGIIIGTFTGLQPWAGWAVNLWSDTPDAANSDHPRTAPYLIRCSRGYAGNALFEPSFRWADWDQSAYLNVKAYTEWNHITYFYYPDSHETALFINEDCVVYTNPDTPGQPSGDYNPPANPVQLYVCYNPGNPDGGGNPMGVSCHFKNLRIWNTCFLSEGKSTLIEDVEHLVARVKELAVSEVTGKESGLVAAWDFATVPEDATKILDKTGTYTARVEGEKVEWQVTQ